MLSHTEKKNHPIISYYLILKKKITSFIHYLIHHLTHSPLITIVCIVVECYQALAIGSGKKKRKAPNIKHFEKKNL